MKTPLLRARAEALMRRTDAALAWENRLNKLGHAVQGFGYGHVLAPDANPLATLLFWGGIEAQVHTLDRFVLNLFFPVIRRFMAKTFKGGDAKRIAECEAKIMEILQTADNALASHPFLTGVHPAYTDIAFCSLLGVFTPSITMTAGDDGQCAWAKGRFSSLLRAKDVYPPALAEFEEHLLSRPCGQLIKRLFAQRGVPLGQWEGFDEL